MKVDVKNISKNKKTYGDQYMKLLMLIFFKKRIFPQAFLGFCQNNSNQPQFLTSGFKLVLKIIDMEQ